MHYAHFITTRYVDISLVIQGDTIVTFSIL